MADSGTFTNVSGSWIVPSVTGNGSSTSADAAWIGIGGVSSNDLIQVGTEDTVSSNGTVSSSCFYEMLPDPALLISGLTVKAGDAMSASIIETATNTWAIEITDTTTSQTYKTSVTYTSTHSSAEWIEEDPSTLNGRLVPFDNFGSVLFSGGFTTRNGSSQSISAALASSITMVNNSGKPVAVPTALNSAGSGFTVNQN